MARGISRDHNATGIFQFCFDVPSLSSGIETRHSVLSLDDCDYSQSSQNRDRFNQQ
jgi:hypothetical protein